MNLAKAMLLSLLIVAVVMAEDAYGRGGRQVPPQEGVEYGGDFFDQLYRMFARFTEGDLRQVFRTARPIQCSELVSDNSEWRDVAFFGGKRFGDWVRTSRVEVKNDPAVYIFTGLCRSQQWTVQVTTKVPFQESLEAFRKAEDPVRKIQVKVNPPVNASFNRDNKSYTFELPYLFRGKDDNGGNVYTLNPRSLSDRYVTHITSRWECKAVAEEYVTYKFLICYTALFGHDPVDIKPDSRDKSASAISFGASGYLILSDGKALADR
jgi:hypothetical protein